MNHPELNHWHTSDIKFGSEDAAKFCLAALEELSNQKIIVHGDGAEVMFEGYFDFIEFDEQFAKTVAKFCQAPCQYAVKNIFNDTDGYFSGWAIVYNEKCEVIKKASLSEIFESDF